MFVIIASRKKQLENNQEGTEITVLGNWSGKPFRDQLKAENYKRKLERNPNLKDIHFMISHVKAVKFIEERTNNG